MKIALAQLSLNNSIEVNLKKAEKAIEESSRNGADLVFFPEVQFSKFFPAYKNFDAEQYLMKINSKEIEAVKLACKKNRISASINTYLLDNGKPYDASITISNDGEIAGVSKMVHIASFPHFYETDYYTPSDEGFVVADVPTADGIAKIGVVICYDRHIPESIRTCALQGADVIIIPTANLKSEPEDVFLWEIKIQAMHSCTPIAMCNRVGREGEIEFCGKSVVVDEAGNVLICADDKEQIVYAEIDLGKARKAKQNSVYLNSRRPEKYQID